MPLNTPTIGRTRQGGQSLIEYLILVALMGVATIGIIRTLQGALNSRYASVIHSLQGTSKRAEIVPINESDLKRKDLGDFMNGAASRDGNSEK
ncbi:MAG: Flp family type IVb pilin [Bdellovibrionales bacterium]|nr:Flp family type IVb pilin [Bdellovibrionales bacterium]